MTEPSTVEFDTIAEPAIVNAHWDPETATRVAEYLQRVAYLLHGKDSWLLDRKLRR